MSTIKISTRIVNVGQVRADEIKEGTFVVYDGMVAEVIGGSFSASGNIELLLSGFFDDQQAPYTRNIEFARGQRLHVVKTMSVRTETE